MSSFSQSLAHLRANARAEAEAELHEAGFAKQASGRWKGSVLQGEHDVEVEIPVEFPDALPVVYASSSESTQAHVEASRKLCIAPQTGVLVDVDRPRAVVRDALMRSAEILRADEATQLAALREEFHAYWADDLIQLISVSDLRNAPTAFLGLSKEPFKVVLAADAESAKNWAQRAGWKLKALAEPLIINLQSLPRPPSFGTKITLENVVALAEEHGGAAAKRNLEKWLARRLTPPRSSGSRPSNWEPPASVILFRTPDAYGSDTVLFAVFVPGPGANKVRRARRASGITTTFRRQKTISPMLKRNVGRMMVERADPSFILRRAGADPSLLEKNVMIIGCGAVGSYLSAHLASLGVGRVTLVDNEILSTANVHRHLLGMRSVGQNKAQALKKTLEGRFPHLSIDAQPLRIEDLLDRPDLEIESVDAVLVALGDETLGRRLDAFLWPSVDRVHAWVEPEGLGGHVLVVRKAETSCYNCLFRRDEDRGLVNRVALASSDHNYLRTLAGCSGTFTPFGALDADRCALEAARQTQLIISTEDSASRLVSWVSTGSPFLAAGLPLSTRGATFQEGETRIDTNFEIKHCRHCHITSDDTV